jgi:hypothetical protein
MLLVVVPGVIFPVFFGYLQSMLDKPLRNNTLVNDRVLVVIILLSILFSYAGIAIHAVTKMLSRVIDKTNREAYELNDYFHNQFSHTLTFSGFPLAIMGLALLELNHVPDTKPISIIGGMLKGLILGVGSWLGIQFWAKYIGWLKLRPVFVVAWICFVLMLYGYKKVNPSITEYQLLLPTLFGFGLVVVLSFVVIIRKVGRGWKVYLSQKRLRKLTSFAEE